MPNEAKVTDHFKNISDYLYFYAKQQPDKIIAVQDNNHVSYEKLANQVDRTAKLLVALGIKKGDRVATLCTPSTEFLIVFLATSSIGAIWIGLNPKYTLDELTYVVSDSKPKLIFSRSEVAGRKYDNEMMHLKDQCDYLEYVILLDESTKSSVIDTYQSLLDKYSSKVNTDELRQYQGLVNKKDSALIVYTSGTTGKPKGALLPHGGLIESYKVQNRIYDCTHMSILNFLPVNHIGCVGDISCSTLIAGGTIYFMEQFEPEECLRLISEEKLTIWGGVPTTFQMCLAHPNFEQYDLSQLQLIIWSGAAAPEEMVRSLAKISPRLGNCYGQTETVGCVTFVPPCDDIDLLTNTVGVPPDEYKVRIVDSNGENSKQGETGEIVVKGSYFMNGYWERPEEMKKTYDAEGWLHTGDLGLQRTDGYISLVGRITEIFISGGYNIYPREIEQVIESYPGVVMAAVIAVPDPLYGEVGHAFILDPEKLVNVGKLEDYCRSRLANYKIPKEFKCHEMLPMLPIGKIDKITLRDSL